MSNIKYVDAVFEGGGVKGIGLVGAASTVEAHGFTWHNLAGTSAGAIVASLLAAGYSGKELKQIVGSLDYNKFKDESALDKIPLIGPLINIYLRKGIYGGNYFESWIQNCLAAKGVRTFRDLIIPGETDPRYRYKLNVITSDITHGLLVILPQGVARYGLNPDDFSVARAVRMSMSIPFFFEAVNLKHGYFVDGGILSNFPVWLFDSEGIPEWPTFGFKFVEPNEDRPNDTATPIALAKSIMSTMMDAHDKIHVEQEDFLRTIAIPTLGVGTTEFDLPAIKRDDLFKSGIQSAETFFETWDFKSYVEKFRVNRAPKYVKKTHALKRSMVFTASAVTGGKISPAPQTILAGPER